MAKGPPPLPKIPYPAWLGALLGLVMPRQVWGMGGEGRAGTLANPLTWDQAQALFAEFKASDIPFKLPEEYCFARAHQMRRLMDEKGIDCAKYWTLPGDGRKLHVPDTVAGPVSWSYHVAPAVLVHGPNGPQPVVLDPSLFDGPVSPQLWADTQGIPGLQPYPTNSRVYQISLNPFWWIPDDDYTRTTPDLNEARRLLTEREKQHGKRK
jgi:hypothetical protein